MVVCAFCGYMLKFVSKPVVVLTDDSVTNGVSKVLFVPAVSFKPAEFK